MKRTLLILTAAIGLFCFGSAIESSAQNDNHLTITNITSDHQVKGFLVTYDNLTWTLPEWYIPTEYGPTEDGEGYAIYIENDAEDYIYILIDPADEEWKKLSPEDKWAECFYALEDYADGIDEGEDPVVWGDSYSKTEDTIVAAGYYYYYPEKNAEEDDDLQYVEYVIAGQYAIAAKAAAWDQKTREEMVAILHSIQVK